MESLTQLLVEESLLFEIHLVRKRKQTSDNESWGERFFLIKTLRGCQSLSFFLSSSDFFRLEKFHSPSRACTLVKGHPNECNGWKRDGWGGQFRDKIFFLLAQPCCAVCRLAGGIDEKIERKIAEERPVIKSPPIDSFFC